MTDARFVHIVDDVPELAERPEGHGPVLVTSLDGFLDAGNASALASGHLTAQRSGRVVAELRGRRVLRLPRPAATADLRGGPLRRLRGAAPGGAADGGPARLVVPADDAGRSRTSAGRPSPGRADRRRALRRAAGGLDGVGADGGAAHPPGAADQPRDRAAAARAGERLERARSGCRPAPSRSSSSAWGSGATTRWASSPTSRTTSPSSTTRRPRWRCSRASRTSPACSGSWTPLKEAGEARQVEIATQIADSDDVRDVVTGLEQQYDAYHTKSANLLADDEPLPSGEEIGAQFEQFLARLEEPEDVERRARLRRRADGPARPRGDRGQPVPRASARHPAPARVRRPGRSPRRWPPRATPSPTATRCTRCTPTSCAPATPPCRSCTTSRGSARAAASPPVGSWPVSTGARSSR